MRLPPSSKCRSGSIAVPVLACVLLGALWGRSASWALLSGAGVALIAAVMVAVHHAEVIALRVR